MLRLRGLFPPTRPSVSLPAQAGGQWLRSRNCPTRLPPKSRAKPQGGRVGETSLGHRTDGQGALAPRGAGGWGLSSRVIHGRPRCAGTAGNRTKKYALAAKGRCQRRPIAHEIVSWPQLVKRVFGTPVAASARWRPMERSRNCPTHPSFLSEPTVVGRPLLQLREVISHPPPKKPSQAAGRAGGRDKRLGRRTERPRRFGKGKS
jgi:hypothetical protein